jgi:UDP-2,4-diacetamido-2,4,6-trideoxy-beta-L-altropyranose hydrolase
MAETILLRADATTRTGTGHVMRCLALAQACQSAGGRAVFAAAQCPPPLAARLAAEGFELIQLDVEAGDGDDARATAGLARRLAARWVVADGYVFGAEYQRAIKESGARLLVVDDYGHAEHYWADAVLNQNINAAAGMYASRESYTHLLLGTRYAMLRNEFWPWRGRTHRVPTVGRRVLVTLGGSDPDDVTLKVAHGLSQVKVEGLEVTLVVGATHPHCEELRRFAESRAGTFHLEEGAADMPGLMSGADVAVSGGGTTSWELAFMGVPAVVIILADNQRGVAEQLGRDGIAVNLGWHGHVSPAEIARATRALLTSAQERREKSRRARALVDGEGGSRVCHYVMSNA